MGDERKLLPKLIAGGLYLQLETLKIKKREPLTLLLVSVDYLHEHVMPQKDVDARRYIYVFNHILRVLDPRLPAREFTRGHVREYIAKRTAEGAAGPTVRRELTLLCAALNHAVLWERLDKIFKFKGLMPEPSSPRQRYLTREEFERLMAAPMDARIYRFFILDFMCGARSRAIEELTWDRVDFKNRTIDFRVPGVVYKNKRRPVQPIIDALLPHLERWHAERRDEYVIGLGSRGKPSTTYHDCKKVMRSIGIDERGVCRHVGRHTVVSWLLQGTEKAKPASLLHVADYIADKATTIKKTYAHVGAKHVFGSVNTLH